MTGIVYAFAAYGAACVIIPAALVAWIVAGEARWHRKQQRRQPVDDPGRALHGQFAELDAALDKILRDGDGRG